MRARRGWSLPELMVALSLASIVFLVVSTAMHSTFRISTLQNRKSAMQGQLVTILQELENTLQRSCMGGISWQPTPAVLAVHCLEQGPSRWETTYRCYLWDRASGRLLARRCPPGPALAAAPSDRCQLLTPADLGLIAAETSGARLLGEGVSGFALEFEPGPLVRLTVELERAVPGRSGKMRQRLARELTLRNRTY